MSIKGPGSGEVGIGEALRASEERFRFLAENVPVQIWTARPDGNLDYVTDQTARALGLTASELMASGWQNVVHPDDLGDAVARWGHALATGETYEVEFRLRLGNGKYAWHLARAIPQRSPKGAIVGWLGTNTNIEEQRAILREREAAFAESQATQARFREQNVLLTLESEVAAALGGLLPIGEALAVSAQAVVQHLGALSVEIWATEGASTAVARLVTRGPLARGPGDAVEIRKIASERASYHSAQLASDAHFGDHEWAEREGVGAFAGYPLVVGEMLVGVLAVFTRLELSKATLAALGVIAHGLAQAKVRRRTEERIRQSESWLATTLKSIGDGVIATDARGRILFLNTVAETLTGFPSSDAVGRTLDEVFPLLNEATRGAVESPVAKVLREGVVVGLANHTLLVRRDGSEIPVDDSAAPIRDGSGNLSGVVLVFRDGGERHRNEAERAKLLAQESRARSDAEAARAELQSLFMQAPAPICILRGPEHRFALANPRYAELVGADRPLLGLPLRQALPEFADQELHALLDRVYATGERYIGNEVHFRLNRRTDGGPEEAILNFVYEPFQGPSGEVLGILVIAFDVTEIVRARRALQSALDNRDQLLAATEEARATSEAASRAKDEFLATASHELRTPLNAILGWARLLRGGALDAAGMARGLETVERNAHAQTKLIEDILDGSRIITGKLHLEIKPFDLTTVVTAALDSVRPAAAAKSIELVTTLDPGAARIHGDPDRIQQVVWNLANNAIKFTPKGGRIEVRLERVDTSIDLSVKDTGEGIGPAFLPHVFERFRQADATTTRTHGGLGLGLALVRHLVEAHGGSVRAASDGVGRGATFTVSLPVQAVYSGAEAQSISGDASGNGDASPPSTLHGVRAVVVDDDPDSRELVSTVLENHGAEVATAASVAQALALLQTFAPTILVSDIGMPVADGYSLIRAVRALPSTLASLPAIALTAYAADRDRERALEAGFHRHLAKPVSPDGLVEAIAELLASTKRR